MNKEELNRREGIAMLIFLVSIVVFMLNGLTGTLVAWIFNYDWKTMSFPTAGTRLLIALWITQGISWLSTASGILSWVYMKKIVKKRQELNE